MVSVHSIILAACSTLFSELGQRKMLGLQSGVGVAIGSKVHKQARDSGIENVQGSSLQQLGAVIVEVKKPEGGEGLTFLRSIRIVGDRNQPLGRRQPPAHPA